MISPIIASNINMAHTKNISFSGQSDTNSTYYKNFNETIKDEFVKNIEDEKEAVITWANDRIEKLNSILNAIAKNDEMPKAEKPKIAAADFHTDRAREVLKELDNSHVKVSDIKYEGPSTAGGFTGNQKNVLHDRVDDATNLTETEKQDLHDKINRSYYEDNQQSFGQGDITDPYTPDDTIDIPDTDTDSCEGCDSGCGDECDCLSDTADCIS